MSNTICFEFDLELKGNKAANEKIELRKDLLTSKGMKDNFSELEYIPVPTYSLEKTHEPYKYGINEMKHIYSIIEYQNINEWPHLEANDIIQIIPLCDYLGLDVVIDHIIKDIKDRFLIQDKSIFQLLIDFPQLREKKECIYSEKELEIIFHSYFDLYQKFPISLANQLLVHSKNMHSLLFKLKQILISFDYKFDHLSLKEFVSDIFELFSGNNDRYNVNYFKQCVSSLQ